jgi:hypothetical protein
MTKRSNSSPPRIAAEMITAALVRRTNHHPKIKQQNPDLHRRVSLAKTESRRYIGVGFLLPLLTLHHVTVASATQRSK